MARLKVYAARMGFFESVVATTSQKAALDAWGTRQNLFGEGLADVTQDPEAVKAALADPGVVLRRPAGGGAFEPASGPAKALPEVPKLQRPKPLAKATPEPAPPKPPPDRSGLT